MSNRDSSSTLWDRAVIILDDGDSADTPPQSPRKVLVRPQRLDVSVLDKIKEGTLIDHTRKIDIFGSLMNYKSYIIDSPVTADLRELSKPEWDNLGAQGRLSIVDSPTAYAEYGRKISRLWAFDDYANYVSQILHQQQLAHPLHAVRTTDLWTEKKYLDQARDDYKKFGLGQIKTLKEPFLALKERRNKAKQAGNQDEYAKAIREMHSHKDQSLYFWSKKMDQGVRKILEPEIWEQIDDIEISYEVFQGLNIKREEEKPTLLELITTLNTSKASLECKIEDTICILDANLNHIQGLFELSHRQSRRALTRMLRLCANDVRTKGEGMQREVMLERFMSGKGFSYFEACRDIDVVRGDLETAKCVFQERVEGGLGELEGWGREYLDVCVGAERAWLKGIAEMRRE
ncbi:hypothetical protein Vi05172_g6974 [Venturia inaequalis]|nr:hypothetical protein Vi05172_g6974 [Venturia inaequalis]